MRNKTKKTSNKNRKPVAKRITYKVGTKLILTKAPASLGFLVGNEVEVTKQSSKDVTFRAPGVLVMSRDEIKKKVFSFRHPETAPAVTADQIMNG